MVQDSSHPILNYQNIDSRPADYLQVVAVVELPPVLLSGFPTIGVDSPQTVWLHHHGISSKNGRRITTLVFAVFVAAFWWFVGRLRSARLLGAGITLTVIGVLGVAQATLHLPNAHMWAPLLALAVWVYWIVCAIFSAVRRARSRMSAGPAET
jgi:hypothetical protein